MGRRGNGEGCIRKIRRVRKDGTVVEFWLGEIMVGRREDGRPDRRSFTGPTREAVAAKIAELVSKKAKGKLVRRSTLTVAAYLRSWLEMYERYGNGGQGLRPNTVRNYRTVIEKHVIPELGNMPLQKVTPDDLERLYRVIEEEKKLSRRMAEMTHRVLYRAFKDAVTKRKLEQNPCELVPNPPRTHYSAADRPVLDAELVPKVLDRVKDTRYYLPLLLAMSTGMRRNELLGLTWSDVDLEAGIVRVRRQWGKTKDKQWGLVPLKTRKGMRDIPLPQHVVDALAAHRVTQEAQGLGPLVFDRGDGKPINPHDLDHMWARVRKDLGLPADLRLHDLRGSYLTWLAESGVDLKTASELAGHADIKVTAEIYQRTTVRTRQKAAQAIEKIVRPPMP